MLIENGFDEDKNMVIVQVIKVIKKKEIFMHLLLHLEEDFDDDLLQDAL